jgi:ADP-ribose pyrophosphatase YjhB (NUDIX family)
MPKKRLKTTEAKPKRLRPSKEVSVMAWIQDSQSRVLLVRQTAGQKLWTLPGGKVRTRESLKDALYRELFEETGLRMQTESWIEIMDRPARGAIMILYEVKLLENTAAKGYQPGREISDVRYCMRLPQNASPSAIYFWNKLRLEGKK